MKIIKPTLIIDKEKTVRNIQRMKEKVDKSGNIRFRPHFKTHQSAEVGEWFRESGVTAITVSSADMASYFAQHGWKDITIAILVNKHEIETVNHMAKKIDLGLLVDSAETASFLHQHLEETVKVNVWIKIDTGYHRTGIEWDQTEKILSTAREIQKSPKLHFQGLLTHTGHSYDAGSVAELKQIYHDTVTKMNEAGDHLKANGFSEVEISIGDTPTCSVIDEFYSIHEVRCGNFVFYDVMQLYLGSCRQEDISAAVACPVIARYPRRNEIAVFGGAVHLSKDYVTGEKGQKIYGLPALPRTNGPAWGPVIEDTYVSSVSQEHGIIKTTKEFLQQIKVGDILMILPVHSCLTANLAKQYRNFDSYIQPGA
jgi:D-serine deaminase-like pyridoxal phosphate-dependent protein